MVGWALSIYWENREEWTAQGHWATLESRSLRHLAAAAKSLQSCPTVWPHRRQPTRCPHPWDSPARTLEWVAISFSSAWKWKVKVKSLSRVWLLATPWTVDHQAPPSMGFSWQEYWSGVPSWHLNPLQWITLKLYIQWGMNAKWIIPAWY